MELLIAGGIALVGYNLSRTAPARPGDASRPARRAAQLGPSNEYAEPGNSTLQATREHVAKAAARWQAARDPALTGIVSPNTKLENAMVPFFRSAKSQNTNDAVKQTLLETFTGENTMDNSLTGTYRRKREVEAMFAPKENAAPVSSGGSGGNRPYERDMQRFVSGTVHNNVLPAQQVQVGRGVGVGPEVSATDGFHPMYRVMMKNVGGYKKNNLPGGVNHGYAPTSDNTNAPKAAYSVNNNPGALVYDMQRRPLMPTEAAVHAAAAQPAQRTGTRKAWLPEMDRFGMAAMGGGGPEARDMQEARHDGTDDPRRNHSLPGTNVTGAVAGMGGFVTANPETERRQCERREKRADLGGALKGPAAGAPPTAWLLPPTQRDATAKALMGAPGGAAALGHAMPRGDVFSRTLRDTQGDSKGPTGAMAAVRGGTMDNVHRYRRLDRQAIKRTNVEHYAPLPGRIGTVEPTRQAVALRQDDRQPLPPTIPSLPNTTYQRQLGKLTTTHNKLQVSNPRLDLSTATQQLQNNPFAHSLWGEGRVSAGLGA